MGVLEKVLIIRNQGIGDLLLITPALRAVRTLHPDAHLALMVGDWSRPAVEGNPHLDEIISYPDAWIQNQQPLGYARLVAKLVRRRFDRVYIFHSHTLIHLMAALAGIPRRYGFCDPDLGKSGRLLTARAVWQPNTDRYIADNYLDVPRLVGPSAGDFKLDLNLSAEEQAGADEILAEHGLVSGQFFAVAPGGGINPRQNVFEKRWGTNRYAAFCRLLRDRFGLPLVLLGSRAEAEIGRSIAAEAGERVVDLIGQASFGQSAGLIRRSKMLVCNDSSMMHVAVAFGVPSLAVFGPSNPRSLLPESRLNQWITAGVDCQPCYCNSIFPGCGHLRCMTELAPKAVLERVEATMADVQTLTG